MVFLTLEMNSVALDALTQDCEESRLVSVHSQTAGLFRTFLSSGEDVVCFLFNDARIGALFMLCECCLGRLSLNTS